MNRLLVHASALACAALVAALLYGALGATAVQAVTVFGALTIVGHGLCVGRRSLIALVPAALAAAGLILVGFSLPAAAAPAHKASALLSALEPPPQPLMLASPAVPQQVVVKVAASDTSADRSISLPVSDWTASARNLLLSLLAALWAVSKNKLPAPVLWALKLYGEDKLINQAVSLALNAVPGAAKGTPLTIDVGNAVLARALQWLVNDIPFALKLLGGEDAIKAKIFAALHLEPEASAAAMGVKASA